MYQKKNSRKIGQTEIEKRLKSYFRKRQKKSSRCLWSLINQRSKLRIYGIKLNGNKFKGVIQEYKHLRLTVCASGEMEENVSHRLYEGARVIGVLGCLWISRCLFTHAKVGMLEDMIGPTVLYRLGPRSNAWISRWKKCTDAGRAYFEEF